MSGRQSPFWVHCGVSFGHKDFSSLSSDYLFPPPASLFADVTFLSLLLLPASHILYKDRETFHLLVHSPKGQLGLDQVSHKLNPCFPRG